MTELEKALAGMEFDHRDAEVSAFTARVKDTLWEAGRLRPSDPRRKGLLDSLFAKSGEWVMIGLGFILERSASDISRGTPRPRSS